MLGLELAICMMSYMSFMKDKTLTIHDQIISYVDQNKPRVMELFGNRFQGDTNVLSQCKLLIDGILLHCLYVALLPHNPPIRDVDFDCIKEGEWRHIWLQPQSRVERMFFRGFRPMSHMGTHLLFLFLMCTALLVILSILIFSTSW